MYSIDSVPSSWYLYVFPFPVCLHQCQSNETQTRVKAERRVFNRSTPQQRITSKIFPVCLTLHVRISGFAHILALLFINGAFAVWWQVFVGFFLCGNTWDFTTYANSQQSCQISGSILCLLSCKENILWQQKKQKKPCIVNNRLLFNIGFMDFIVDLLHAVGSSCTAC